MVLDKFMNSEKYQENEKKRKRNPPKKVEISDKDKNRKYITLDSLEKLGRRCRTCLLQDGMINVFTTQHNTILFSNLFAKFSLCQLSDVWEKKKKKIIKRLEKTPNLGDVDKPILF